MAKKPRIDIDRKTISKILNCVLEIRGMTSNQLAYHADVTPKMVRDYINGYVRPSVEVWEKICKILDIPPICKESFDPNDDNIDLEKREDNRLRYFYKELSAREDRRKKWIELFLLCGYPEEEIKHYVRPIYDPLPDNDIKDVANDFKASQILGM